MSISLKQAFSACLWLAERKLGIPTSQQRGEWDLTKRKDLEFSRRDLVTHLPSNYFVESSCYFGSVKDGVFDKEGIYYSGSYYFDASNFIDGSLFKYDNEQYFQDFSPFRESDYFVSQENEDLVPTPENVNTLITRQLPLLAIDELNENSCANEDKPRLAEVAAHITLTNKLRNSELDLEGYIKKIEYIDYLNSESSFDSPIPIPITPKLWQSGVIPNYEESALEIGQNRYIKLSIDVLLEENIKRKEYLSKCEYWYAKIKIKNEQYFTNWLTVEVRNALPFPTKATFKPHGKGYLINFGADKEVEIKSSKGLNIIFKLIKSYCTPSFRDNFGYSDEAIYIDTLNEEIESFEKSTRANQTKQESIRKYIRKQQNLIFWYLEQLKDYEEELQNNENYTPESINTSENILKPKEIKSAILSRFNKIKAIKQNEVDIINKNDFELLMNLNPEQFVDKRDSIKNFFKVEMTDKEKNIDGIRKNINSSIKTLQEKAPHFAKFLGSATSKAINGIGYNNDLFYIVSSKTIQWDFG